MGTVQWKNNATGQLAAQLLAGASTATLKSGHGNNFPQVDNGSGDWFKVTFVDVSGNREICKCTRRDTDSDVLYITRAQEGTDARQFEIDDIASHRITAAEMDSLTEGGQDYLNNHKETGGSTHPAATTSVAGFLSAADKTKLDGIEAEAEVNQTNAELLAQIIQVDGAGSGLDADKLDGSHWSTALNSSTTVGGQTTVEITIGTFSGHQFFRTSVYCTSQTSKMAATPDSNKSDEVENMDHEISWSIVRTSGGVWKLSITNIYASSLSVYYRVDRWV